MIESTPGVASNCCTVGTSSVRTPTVLPIAIRCPSSGEVERNRWENLAHLKGSDEIKFVIQDRQDYENAQRYWRQAYEIVTAMIEESNELFFKLGEERVEYHASADYYATGEWPIMKAEFQKYVK